MAQRGSGGYDPGRRGSEARPENQGDAAALSTVVRRGAATRRHRVSASV